VLEIDVRALRENDLLRLSKGLKRGSGRSKTQEVEMAKRKIRFREKDNTDILGLRVEKSGLVVLRRKREPFVLSGSYVGYF
jgi:hypothetical protein